MAKFFIKAVCALFLLFALPAAGIACRCAGPISPSTAYQRAQAVVVGKVLDLKGDRDKEGATARIAVSRAWKQRVDAEVEVFTSTTCAFDFQVGEEYLLYLYESPKTKGYTTKKCLGNQTVVQAGKSLAWLERHYPGHLEGEKKAGSK